MQTDCTMFAHAYCKSVDSLLIVTLPTMSTGSVYSYTVQVQVHVHIHVNARTIAAVKGKKTKKIKS